MNDRDNDSLEPAPLPDALRWRLHGLRQDALPAVDLWDGIRDRIGQTPRRRRKPWGWTALAASLVLAIGLGRSLRPVDPVSEQRTVVMREAGALSDAYRRALEQIPPMPAAAPLAPAIRELDRSTGEIRHALARDPDSRLLLEQLQRTYARRLALSRRALYG